MSAQGLTPRCPADPEEGPHLPVPEIDPPVHITTVVAGQKQPGTQRFFGITRVCQRCWLYYFEPSMQLLADLEKSRKIEPPKRVRPS